MQWSYKSCNTSYVANDNIQICNTMASDLNILQILQRKQLFLLIKNFVETKEFFEVKKPNSTKFQRFKTQRHLERLILSFTCAQTILIQLYSHFFFF